MAIVIAALLGLSALLVVLAPLPMTAHDGIRAEGTLTSGLAERENAAKAALQDVEFDYQLGNLAEDDYRALRERYTRRALAALKGRYDRERALDDTIEAEVRALNTPETVTPSDGRPTSATGQTPSSRPRPRTVASRGKAARTSSARRASAPGKNGHGRT